MLERVRLIGALSAEQRNDWEYFKTNWDKDMAESHGEDWAQLFAEIIQHVVEELGNGNTNALSDFMHRESKRVFADIPSLVMPGS